MRTGRDALQEYFDTIFTQKDLDECLQDNKAFLSKGQFRFTEEELKTVYPTGICSGLLHLISLEELLYPIHYYKHVSPIFNIFHPQFDRLQYESDVSIV